MKNGNLKSRDDTTEARFDFHLGDSHICLKHEHVGILSYEFIEDVAERDEVIFGIHGLEAQILKSSICLSLLLATLSHRS